jgi:hypothetical protein
MEQMKSFLSGIDSQRGYVLEFMYAIGEVICQAYSDTRDSFVLTEGI